jgi:hypothetical protein
VVRFARLIHRRGRVLGGPAVRAAFGGNLILPWLLRTVVRQPSVADLHLGSVAGGETVELDRTYW